MATMWSYGKVVLLVIACAVFIYMVTKFWHENIDVVESPERNVEPPSSRYDSRKLAWIDDAEEDEDKSTSVKRDFDASSINDTDLHNWVLFITAEKISVKDKRNHGRRSDNRLNKGDKSSFNLTSFYMIDNVKGKNVADYNFTRFDSFEDMIQIVEEGTKHLNSTPFYLLQLLQENVVTNVLPDEYKVKNIKDFDLLNSSKSNLITNATDQNSKTETLSEGNHSDRQYEISSVPNKTYDDEQSTINNQLKPKTTVYDLTMFDEIKENQDKDKIKNLGLYANEGDQTSVENVASYDGLNRSLVAIFHVERNYVYNLLPEPLKTSNSSYESETSIEQVKNADSMNVEGEHNSKIHKVKSQNVEPTKMSGQQQTTPAKDYRFILETNNGDDKRNELPSSDEMEPRPSFDEFTEYVKNHSEEMNHDLLAIKEKLVPQQHKVSREQQPADANVSLKERYFRLLHKIKEEKKKSVKCSSDRQGSLD